MMVRKAETDFTSGRVFWGRMEDEGEGEQLQSLYTVKCSIPKHLQCLHDYTHS